MKGNFLLTLLLLLVFFSEDFAQTTDQQFIRRDCSFVGRPIVDSRRGTVIGKAIKLVKPRIRGKLKKLAQGKIVEVKIEVDETGKVIYAEAGEGIAELRNVSEQAARLSEFNPTTVDAAPSKTKGKLIYKFNRGKTEISDGFESSEIQSQPIDYNLINLLRTFDSEILSVIYEVRDGNKSFSYPFVKNGRAKIQICINTKAPETVKKIEQTDFNILEETKGNGLVGTIAVENIKKLADIKEIRFIVPEP